MHPSIYILTNQGFSHNIILNNRLIIPIANCLSDNRLCYQGLLCWHEACNQPILDCALSSYLEQVLRIRPIHALDINLVFKAITVIQAMLHVFQVLSALHQSIRFNVSYPTLTSLYFLGQSTPIMGSVVTIYLEIR